MTISTPIRMVGAIDQGTSSTRFILFDRETLRVVHRQRSSIPLASRAPQQGWAELCPRKIMASVVDAMETAATHLASEAIVEVWYDNRTTDLVTKFREKELGATATVQSLTGLPLSPYFSAVKIKWLLESEPYASRIRQALEKSNLRVGTIDTWILDRITGGRSYFTDITNASRTSLMNIHTGMWDASLFEFFELDPLLISVMPEIRSNCDPLFGNAAIFKKDSLLDGVPITAMLGDQHASLLGHHCLHPGEAKATFGTGCFLMMNTGNELIFSPGLITTIAFKLGKNAPLLHALEGSIAMASRLMGWLQETLHIPPQQDGSMEIDTLLSQAPDAGGVSFLSSLTGIYSPVWRSDLKGSIHGLTLETRPEHIGRAALESIAFQTKMIIDEMTRCSVRGETSVGLSIDGGLSLSTVLCQIEADVLSRPIIRPAEQELSALGGAVAALIGANDDTMDHILSRLQRCDAMRNADCFSPKITQQNVEAFVRWKKLLERELARHY